jgi:hypothetical protein
MDKFIYADVDVNYNDIRLVNRPGLRNYKKQIFYWSEGKIYRDYLEQGNFNTDEFAYIHLQKRKLKNPDFADEVKSFYITGFGFIEKTGGCTTEEIVLKLNPYDENIPKVLRNGAYKKDLRWYWIGRRILNFKSETKKRLRKIVYIMREGKNSKK